MASKNIKTLTKQIKQAFTRDQLLDMGVPEEEMFNYEHFKIMPVQLIIKADWNYKTEDAGLSQKLQNNLKRNGQVENIIVRLLPTGFYEVCNGNHRYDEIVNLNRQFIIVYDLGAVTLAEAQRLTIETNETKFSTDDLRFGELMKSVAVEFNVDDLIDTLPFDDLTINSFFDLSGVDGDQGAGSSPGNSGDSEYQPIKLTDRFIIPPFSLLDTRQAYWLDRKRAWLKITGNLTETKEGVLGNNTLISEINDGSSNFDPVLAEIIMKWFNVENGAILDPFGGEQTKGVVAGYLGYKYTAVEFRKDQCELNQRKTANYKGVTYYNGDSNNISTIIPDRGFDLCFTSPPYYDLEIYSKEDMSALGTYEEFMAQYKNIFSQCYDMLNDNRFLVVKICEIRDKKTGVYRNFVGDNIQIFKDIGFHYYNEIILINAIGTLPFRAGKVFASGRKVGKMHQNVLVFFKGNPDKIKGAYKEFAIEDLDGFTDAVG